MSLSNNDFRKKKKKKKKLKEQGKGESARVSGNNNETIAPMVDEKNCDEVKQTPNVNHVSHTNDVLEGEPSNEK